MEYAVLKVTHPTWLTMQLPTEVAELIRFPGEDRGAAGGRRSISFLTRGAGIARVVATQSAREALAVETVRNRFLASASPGATLLFTLPTRVAGHLKLELVARSGRSRGTDDNLLWLAPAAEYHEYRRTTASKERWAGFEGGRLAHVYLVKSVVPLPKDVAGLAESDARIEEEEWRPAVEVLQRLDRGRRSAA